MKKVFTILAILCLFITCNTKSGDKRLGLAYINTSKLMKENNEANEIEFKYKSKLENKQNQIDVETAILKQDSINLLNNADFSLRENNQKRLLQLYNFKKLFTNQLQKDKATELDSLLVKLKKIINKRSKEKGINYEFVSSGNLADVAKSENDKTIEVSKWLNSQNKSSSKGKINTAVSILNLEIEKISKPEPITSQTTNNPVAIIKESHSVKKPRLKTKRFKTNKIAVFHKKNTENVAIIEDKPKSQLVLKDTLKNNIVQNPQIENQQVIVKSNIDSIENDRVKIKEIIITPENSYEKEIIKNNPVTESYLSEEENNALETAIKQTDNSTNNLAQVLEESKKNRQLLLTKLDSTTTTLEKNKNVPRLSKNIFSDNNELESLIKETTQSNIKLNELIGQYENLYLERLEKVPNKDDLANQEYLKKIEKLKADQILAEQLNEGFISKFEKIKSEMDLQKNSRIKSAVFVSEQERYKQDRESLKKIIETTVITNETFKPEDFDYGDDEQINMEIIKNIANVSNGYYLIIAVHKDIAKRDAFLTKVVSAGQSNIDFFFNSNTNKYYIYYDKYDSMQEAVNTLETKGSKPYNGNMSVVKVENKISI